MIGNEKVEINSNQNIKQNTGNVQQQQNQENQNEEQNPQNFNEFDEDEELFLRQKLKPFKMIEFIFIIAIICVAGFIWIKVLRKPLPKGLLRIFGMDDTLYPEQYEKILKARQQQQQQQH